MGKMKRHISLRSAFTLSALALVAQDAHSATRTVYFNATGINRTQFGLSASATSTCKITITNPSSVSQTMSISTSPTSVNHWSSSTASVAGSAGSVVAGQAGCSSSCTLAAGAFTTISYSFTAYPTKTAGTTDSKQQLRCSGSITAGDVTTPGFLIANGELITFVESAKMNTDAHTGGSESTNTFGGIAVYTKGPISINRAKPF